MYFINTNWKHLQLLTVTFITLEIHGTDIGTGIVHRLTCGHHIAAGSLGAAQPHTCGAKSAELSPLTQSPGTRILPCPKVTVSPALPFLG